MALRQWMISGGAIAIVLTCAAASAPSRTLLATVLADSGRPAADKARDEDRKPADVIAFSKLRVGDSVAELAPGGGYFTRILAGVVGPKGHIYAMSGRALPDLAEYAKTHTNIQIIMTHPGEITPPAPVDMVWTTLNYHDFKNAKVGDSDAATLLNAAAFKALKPGGYYFIVDHQTAPGIGVTQTATLHRIEDVVVKREVMAAGFVLDGESSLLHHAADDHTLKVVESGLRGKTDQFILRFRKPKG